MNLSRLEKEIAGIVIKINEFHDLIHYPYHKLDHTESLVSYAKEIAAFYLLNEKDVFIVTVAAWFHDIGHLYGVMQGHEERGVLIMEQYLKGVPKELITSVSECIMATKFPSNPRTLRHAIIFDAVTHLFRTSLFSQTHVLLTKDTPHPTLTTHPHL